ncbi:MAG TPA: hypothetical protein VFP03_07155 [Jiangellaceae bacterium]|nr:hypothetical protein [Jiangellaceae bacterium]
MPSLVVLDGVNEAMSLHGMKIREEDGAAAYRRRLVKPCTKVGAAVVSCDHVVKDEDKQGRHALGSIHKGNGLTGSLIKLENVEAFGRGQSGASHMFVTNDRPGYLRQHGRPGKIPGKTYIGTLKVDDTRKRHDYLELEFHWPKGEATTDGVEPVSQRDADDATVLAAVDRLVAVGKGPSRRKIEATAGISKPRVGDSLVRLELRGEHGGLIMTKVGTAHLFN